jgi:hypothetical protein
MSSYDTTGVLRFGAVIVPGNDADQCEIQAER